jgi:putative CocE/NonD family hydrolase
MTPSLRLPAIALACLLAGSCDTIREDFGVFDEASEETEEPAFTAPAGSVAMMHQQARMRDGVRLNTSVWLPQAEGKFPVVLIRTPYRTEMRDFQATLLRNGYAVIEQHERGRYLSEGEMRMLGRADEDGWDTLEWIAKQPWSNGRVATYGCSSSAENQLKLASLGHPTHKAMIVGSSGVGIAQAGPHREQGNFWRGGAWQMGWASYFFEEMQAAWPQLPLGLSDAERTRLSAMFRFDGDAAPIPQSVYDEKRMHLPVIELPEAVGAPETELADYIMRGPSNTAWAQDRVTDHDAIKVPGLWAEALYDISAPSAAALFERTRKANPALSQTIVITNGQHCSFNEPRTKIGDRALGAATFDHDRMALAWLDRWLKDDQFAATQRSPVTVYLAGINRWASFDAIPQAGQDETKTLWLDSSGSANTAKGDGLLVEAEPPVQAIDRFAYDPANPVITHGGQISGMGEDQKDGAFDQRRIEERPDVLVYTSAPLAEDLAVFGYVETELHVASDAPDTDFTVKLVDVAPDGTAWNIADTILRMRYRDGDARPSFMKKGEIYPITPPPMLAGNVFLKGHQIRIEVSSSNFPAYARNLNTAGDPYLTKETQVANNEVVHGPYRPSRIMLPVVTLPARIPRTP